MHDNQPKQQGIAEIRITHCGYPHATTKIKYGFKLLEGEPAWLEERLVHTTRDELIDSLR